MHAKDIKEAFTGHLPNDAKKIPETGAPAKMIVPEPKGELSSPVKSLKALPPKAEDKAAEDEAKMAAITKAVDGTEKKPEEKKPAEKKPADKKPAATETLVQSQNDPVSEKRIDHTLGGVDVPKVALKGLVSDAYSPLTTSNVKTEEQKADESKGNTLPLTHYQDVADFANGEKAHETKKTVTAWELPSFVATKLSHKPSNPDKLVQTSDEMDDILYDHTEIQFVDDA